MTAAPAPSGTAKFALSYNCDQYGRFSSLRSPNANSGDTILTYPFLPNSNHVSGITYSYNDRSELTSADATTDTLYNFGFDYDTIGNRVSSTSNATGTPITSYYPTNTPTYNDDGCMLTNGNWTYTWNGENSLIEAVKNEGYKLEFKYDYMGRRIEKKVYSWVSSAWQLDKTEKFAWSKWNLVGVFDAANALQKSMLWGEDLSGSLQGAGGVGGLLAVTDHNSSKSYLPCYDGNGNVMPYVDSADGNNVAEYEYSPDPKIIVKSGAMADEFEFRFSTQYYDKELDSTHYLNREFLHSIGRWSQRDRINENGGLNLYAGMNNDPINQIDVLGNDAYLVYRPLNIALLYMTHPKTYGFELVSTGHVYLAFDGEHFPKGEWEKTLARYSKTQCCPKRFKNAPNPEFC